LFPGLAVACRLKRDCPGIRVTFAGSGREFERRLVIDAGYDYLPLPGRPWPERLSQWFSFALDHVRGYWLAARFLKEECASVVVGLGGYASVGVARAAARRGLPLLLLEQNAVPGRATRWLAPRATLVCTSFHQSHEYLPRRCHFRLTGNPVRPEFCGWRVAGGAGREGLESSAELSTAAPPPATHTPPRATLTVLGGSGGARSLNENVPRALYRLRAALAGWRIVHQTGRFHDEGTRRLYAALRLPAEVVPTVDDMPALLRETDLAVCRAGGTTLAELAAAGVPAVLIPYPFATADHQRKNAEVFAASGGCRLLVERDLAGPWDRPLALLLQPLVRDARRRQAMSTAIHRLAHADAAWDVATMVRRLAGYSGPIRQYAV
jgi:UDP-N-acetylglucosamine--N-acetylmuramyl-(pentapeptide) pyrophosphoryl-undecaprenol N-acetylglucosamine transferase